MRSQLQQVEAALVTSPDDAGLLKLRDDIVLLIQLKTELAPSGSLGAIADERATAVAASGRTWRTGDLCQGVWTDGSYRDARIAAIANDRVTCSIAFELTDQETLAGSQETLADVSVNSLRPRLSGGAGAAVDRKKRTHDEANGASTSHSAGAGHGANYHHPSREHQAGATGTAVSSPSSSASAVGHDAGSDGEPSNPAKKSRQTRQEFLAKQAKLKERKEKHEESVKAKAKEVTDWRSFAAKSKSGIKTSIFAAPKHLDGKVGVGTCGIGGKPPTDVSAAAKASTNWRAALKPEGSANAAPTGDDE